jgi:hypothetical protein
MFDSRLRRPVLAGAAGLASVLLLGSASHADPPCREVEGSYQERDTSGPGCTSPVGLCIAGQYRGDIKGAFAGQASTIVPTADTATTGVLLFTSDSVIEARIGRRSGTLIIKNSGAFRTIADGSIVDLQAIVGGTGDFTGASGALRAEGTFTNGAGESDYTGTVCVS